MGEGAAFVLALVLLIGATAIARKYLTGDARTALTAIAMLARLV